MYTKIILISGFLLFAQNSFSQSIILNEMAIDQFEKSQIDSAFTLLDKAQKQDSTYSETYYNRAVMYRDMGMKDLAIIQFSKAIHFNPADIDSYMNRGILFFDNHKDDLALNDFNTVLKSEPERKEALLNIGLIYFNSKNLKEAESIFLKCVELDTNYASAYFRLAKIKMQQEKHSEAYAYLNKCISINPEKLEYFEFRAIMNLMKGDNKKACEDLWKAIQLGSVDNTIIKAHAKECH
ncbi:MAG: tetratricopeptide repeat protein [Fluviicola sp.]